MIAIRTATNADAHAIQKLLREYELRPEGILEHGTAYWVAEDSALIVGVIGLECAHPSVLLRSAIVDPRVRRRGLGRQLTECALDWARSGGYRTAYCFSTDAGGYWLSRGFHSCSVQEVVEALPGAPQVMLFHDLGWLPAEQAYKIYLL